SMPLHNTLYDSYNRQYRNATDGIVNDEAPDHLEQTKIYPIQIKSEDDFGLMPGRGIFCRWDFGQVRHEEELSTSN
ncbi:MAG: hypothetical protein WAN11_25765, partial [Syntrophobacteraceae bacterium]